MGQWVFFHTPRAWRFNTWQTPYVNAHGAALADFVGEGSLRVGQDAAGGKWYVLRSGAHFYTGDLPDAAEVLSAAIAFSQSGLDAAIPLLAGFSLHVVKGSGLHAPAVAGDFGYLLGKVTPYGTIWIPKGGLVQDTYYDIPLFANGVAVINPAGWTRYGLRSSDDIDSNTDHVVDDYITIRAYGEPFFVGLTRTVEAAGVPGGAKFTGLLSEDGLARLHIKLVASVAKPGNFSNIDVRFQYGIIAVTENATSWRHNQEIETPFSMVAAGMDPETTYKYRAQSRIMMEDGTYYTASGPTLTVDTLSLAGTDANPGAILLM